MIIGNNKQTNQKSFKNITNLPIPKFPIITRWGTWTVFAVFLSENYNKIKELKEKDYLSFLKGKITISEGEIDYSAHLKVDRKGYSFKIMPWGLILLKTEIDKDLYAEAMLSEVRRRIQIMRKELQLVESDSINVFIDCSKEMKQMLEGKVEELKEEVNAKKISFEDGGRLKKKWDIEEEKLSIGISEIK